MSLYSSSKFRTNRTLNIVCAICHASLAFLWGYRKYNEYKIPATYGIYINALDSDGLGGLEVVARKKEKTSFDVDTRDLMIAFFAVTSVFHLIYAAGSGEDGYYTNMLVRGNNMLRWVEYSITSTLMINVISRISGVNNENILKLMTAANVCIMIQGQTTEVVLASKMSKREKIKRVLVPNITAWVLLFTIFNIIISKFSQILEDVENGVNKGKPLEEQIKIPDAVRIAVWSQFGFFSVFGLVQLVQIFREINSEGGGDNYINYEMTYNILSLASKATLGIALGFGIEQSEGRDENNGNTSVDIIV